MVSITAILQIREKLKLHYLIIPRTYYLGFTFDLVIEKDERRCLVLLKYLKGNVETELLNLLGILTAIWIRADELPSPSVNIILLILKDEELTYSNYGMIENHIGKLSARISGNKKISSQIIDYEKLLDPRIIENVEKEIRKILETKV